MYDMRIQRRKGFKDYHAAAVRLGECDTAYPIMQYLAKENRLDLEQRYWLAFLYASTYSACSAWYIFTVFPDAHDTTTAGLEAWYKANKSATLFQTDRRWVGYNDEFVKMVDSYKAHIGDSADDFFRGLCNGTEADNYESVIDATDNLYYFSRFSRFLLFESTKELTGLPITPRPNALDLRIGKVCRQGLNHVLGQDSQAAQARLPSEAYPPLQRELALLIDECARDFPDFINTVWSVETNLCAWRKLFKGTRYWGYYVDRGMDEIHWYEKHHPEIDWWPAWKARRAVIHPSLLGELNGWDGIREELLDLFPRKGILSESPIAQTQGRVKGE